MTRIDPRDFVNKDGGGFGEIPKGFVDFESHPENRSQSRGGNEINPSQLLTLRGSYIASNPVSGPLATPAQAYVLAPAPTYAQAPAQAYVLAPAQTWTHQALAQTPITIVDPNIYTLIAPQRIHNEYCNNYTWQQNTSNRNFDVFSDEGNAIYSAMHVDNIMGANKARNLDHFYADFTMANGESKRFVGLRLGDFVYFNFTTEPVYVGEGRGLRLPTNNLFNLGHPAVQANYATQQQAVSVLANTGASYRRNTTLNPAPAPRPLRREINQPRVQSGYQERGSWLPPILSIFSSAQENIQSTVLEIRLRASEGARDEAEQRARAAQASADAAKDLAAERERAAKALRRELDAAAEAQAALRREKDQAAKDLAADLAAAEAEITELKQAKAKAETETRAAKDLAAAEAPQNELADTNLDWKEWTEPDQRKQSQEIGVQTDDILSQPEKDLAAEREQATAAKAARALAAETARANAAEEEIAILKGSISSFRVSLENIKTQFEKLKNLFGSEDIKTKPKPNIEYKQGDIQNNFKLKWIINLDELKKKTTGYNIFLKFTAFSDDHQSEEEQQQKALSQVALLKLKLIELGKNNDSEYFLNHKETINAYLSEVSKLMAVNNFDLNDKETKEFCEEYFLLGQQYKKILEKEKNKPDSNIKKMMSYEFKKDKICYDNESAREYLGFNEDRFEAEFTLVSSNAFNSIIEAHSDSSDKTKANAKAKAKDDANDDAKKNDDKIILLNSFILSLEQACKGHEEIVKDSSDQIEISPEVAKVFVALDNFEAGKLWNSLSCEKQIQLKVFLKQELQYSQVEQEGVVGRSKIDINKYVDKRKEGESSWMFSKIFDTLITKQEKKEIKKKFDAPTKEVSDFFEKRKLRCEELLDYKVKDKLEDLPLSRQDGVNSAVEKKNDVFSNFLDLLNQVIIKFNEDFKQILRGEEEETSPVTVQAAARREGEGEEAGGVGDGRRNPAPAPAPAHAAAAPGPVAGRGGGGGD